MRIAILASGNGEKAIYLHDFFKEGNRISVDCLLTDNASSPVALAFGEEGVEVIVIDSQTDMGALTSRFAAHDVKLLVVDGWQEVPPSLKEFFGAGIVSPATAAGAPLEVITAAEKLTAPEKKEPKIRPFGKSDEPKDVDREWSEALNLTPREQPVINPAPAKTEVKEPQPQGAPGNQQQPPAMPGNQQPQPTPPPYTQGPGPEPMPETYLVWSVVLTILCCLISGIIAIIYSTKVSSRYYAGNIEGAKRASRNAQIWCIVSVIAGILWLTFYVPLALLV